MRTDSDNNKRFEVDLGTLYEDNREMIVQVAFRVTGDRETAEDALQNVFVRLLELPKEKQQRELIKNAKGYLYRAAMNEAIHLYNARERRRLDDDPVEELEIGFPDEDAEILHLRAMMEKLKPDSLELLRLHYFHGYTCKQIAKMQRKAMGTVLYNLCRARTELKKLIRIEEKRNETPEQKLPGNGNRLDAKASEA